MAIGYLFALTAALLWGISGSLAQYLFQNREITPEWLVTVRMLLASFILLLPSLYRKPEKILDLLKEKKDRLDLLFFAIFGMLAVQFTYFVTIKHSNAATATILQYLGPVFIAGFYTAKEKRIPVFRESFAIFLALLGTFLIVTHGSLKTISVSQEAFWWGIVSAIALATYSILPIRLMRHYDASLVVGLGMFIGGVSLGFIFNPFNRPGQWDFVSVLFLVLIVLFGTALPFYLYLRAVKIVGATKASLLACVEPLSAAVVAVVWLKVSFGVFDWLGTFCIILTIGILTNKK